MRRAKAEEANVYQVLLLLSDDGGGEAVPALAALSGALDHARDWPGAKKAAQSARSALALTDELPSPERLQPFVARVAAAAKQHKCVAIWWKPADRLLAPATLAEAAKAKDPLRAALQLRLFHVEGGEDEHVVDTIGLAALGLPDVQCHFEGLDPVAAGAAVERAARYLFDEGDVIGDGDSLEGPDGEAWICRHEESLLAPLRDVIDIGAPDGKR